MMSNNNNDKSGNVPVSQQPSSPAANPASRNQAGPGAEASPPINQAGASATRPPDGLFDEGSKAPIEHSGSVGRAGHEVPDHRRSAAADSPPPAPRPALQPTGSELGRPAIDTGSATARPAMSPIAEHKPGAASALEGGGTAAQQNRTPLEAQTQSGGARPPGPPPASTGASCPEEPKSDDGTQPPPFDIEEFMRA